MAQADLLDQPISVNFLEGVNEVDDPTELKPSEWLSAKGSVPNFNGLMERIGGKIAIAKYDSEIRSIHQSFVPYGAFGFYVTTKDELLFFQNCPNPRLTVNPVVPPSIGVDSQGFTLDKLGRSSGASGTQSSSVITEKKIATLQFCMAVEPAPPAEGFLLLTNPAFDAIYNSNIIQIRAGELPNAVDFFNVIATYEKNVDYTIGDGQYLNFTEAVETIRGSFPSYAFFSIWATDNEDEEGPYSVYNLTLDESDPPDTVFIEPNNPFCVDITTENPLPDTALFHANAEANGWRFMLSYFEFGEDANRGFKLMSRVSPTAFALVYEYRRGTEYEVTDDFLDFTAEASVLSSNRDYRFIEICDTGSGEFDSTCGLNVMSVGPVEELLNVNPFDFRIGVPGDTNHVVLQNSSFGT